ncbi:MAG TPA: universal stress protein [Gaiellaceae bacterium]|jgi:nucleotide-binding universal stress UspA family protein|nr:universal stress protein [Gaiellaceae bacterium]
MSEGRIVIAYDGSENARHAIAVAAAEIGTGPATVVHAWEPLSSASSRLAVYAMIAGGPEQERAWERDPLAWERDQAQAKAEEGAALARELGFDANAVAIEGESPAVRTLVEYIDEQRPRLVVMGTRGLTGLSGFAAGSVSHGVAAHVHVPVFIVPPEEQTPAT